MSWNWVAVLFIVVLAWTVLRVTTAWVTVTMYRYSPETTKRDLYEEYTKTLEKP